MTDANKTRFNAEAAAWDQNPDVHLASKNALEALLRTHSKLQSEDVKTLDVIEIGCGTGLLTIPVSSYVNSILAIDASTGMVAALESKLSAPTAPKNIQPLAIMLEDPEDPQLPPANPSTSTSSSSRRKFDLALSHLTLHHIPSMKSFLRTIYGTLKPGVGEIFLTDFEDFGPEARKFHPGAKMDGVMRDGISREEIEALLGETGFENIVVEVGWRQVKDVERWEGEWSPTGKKPEGQVDKMEFPFLVMRGIRGV